MLMSPYIKVWPQAMLLGLQPSHIKTTLNDLTLLSDEIWHIAGDKSTDMTWYVKRVLLLKAYAFTETHMLADESKDFQATWEFLDRRLTEMEGVIGAVNNAGPLTSSIITGIGSIASILSPQNLSMDDTYMQYLQRK